MPATPAHGHTEEFEQLAGLSALDVLEGEDRARFEQHAAQCGRCRQMVLIDKEALAALSLTAPPMDPSPDFKARLMRRAAAELEASAATVQPGDAEPDQPVEVSRPVQIQSRRPSNVVPFWRRSPWVSSLAAVLVLGLVTFGAFTYENQPIATYELTGSLSGKAVVIVRRSGAAELEMHGVPDPEPGFLYEAWVIPEGQKPVAAGTTTRGEAKVPLPGNVRGSTVAITKERTRVDAPTSPPVLATVVQL
jgi:anti-sigma-K factor RskA